MAKRKDCFGGDPSTMSESEIALGNLTAVIFRDGGQRLACIGDWQLAADEAERTVHALRRRIDEQNLEIAHLKAKLSQMNGASPRGMLGG